MTQKELLDLLMLRLAHRTNPAIRQGAALELKLKQQNFEQANEFRPWFLLTEFTDPDFKTLAGDPTVQLPETFLSLEEDLDPFLYYYDATVPKWLPLVHVSNWERPTDDGPPRTFTIVGKSLRISPDPDKEYPLKLWANFAQPAFSDTDTETLWTKHAAEWLLNSALAEVALLHLTDPTVAQKAMLAAKEAKAALYGRTIARLSEGQQMTMGES